MGLLSFAARRGLSKEYEEGTTIFTLVVLLTSVLGLYWQLSTIISGLPFPINILVLPLRISEAVLLYFVGKA